MRIKIINPTVTEAFTHKNLAAGKAVAAVGTEIISVQPSTGPVSIEGHYDEAISVVGILEEVRQGEEDGIDGYVIACFGDPGVFAAREAARGPVLGIAEAAMQVASIISTGFSIVTTLSRTKIIAEHLVKIHGFENQCRRIRATNLEVLSLEESGFQIKQQITEECRRALDEDESGAIVLGCAGMADLAAEVSAEIGAPVVEGVAAAVKLVESVVALGLGTSKVGDLAYPIPKQYCGRMSYLSPNRISSAVIN
jgi:allantoin racemase